MVFVPPHRAPERVPDPSMRSMDFADGGGPANDPYDDGDGMNEVALQTLLQEEKEESDQLMSVHVGLSRRLSSILAVRPQTGIVVRLSLTL